MSSTDSLREQIEKIVTAEYYSPNAEPAVKRIDRVMHLIEQYGLEQRIDELRGFLDLPVPAKAIVIRDLKNRIRELERKKEEL